MTEDLVLHGSRIWTSPYVFSVFVFLKEKGVPFRMELLDTESGEHLKPPYEVDSFTGRLPALRHDRTRITPGCRRRRRRRPRELWCR
jgi:glutathione S-transferase